MKKRARLSAILILVVTVVLSIAAIWIGIRLSQQSNVDPDDSQAASEQVTNADKLKTQAQRDDFNLKWKDFIADESHTWEDYVNFATGDGARYECDTVIMDKVGEETIYGCDLNVTFVIQELPTYISSEAIGPQNSTLNKVLDELITQSGLLQKGEDNKLITLNNTIFNSTGKDYFKRIDAVSNMRDLIGDQFVKTIDFDAITIYFHNQENPEIPLEQAKIAAKAKMDNLYNRLKTGEITMEQAGDEIEADSIKGDTTGISLLKLDRLFKENAYMSIENHVFGDRIFTDETYDEELRSLAEGQMSTVRLCKDYEFTPDELAQAGEDTDLPLVDSCYVIFKLNKINFGIDTANKNSETEDEYETDILDEYKENVEVKL